MLSRNGKEFPVTGATNVRAGTEYKVTSERPTLSLSVTELDAGSWVMFELPGFTTADSGTAIGSGLNSGPGGGARLQASK